MAGVSPIASCLWAVREHRGKGLSASLRCLHWSCSAHHGHSGCAAWSRYKPPMTFSFTVHRISAKTSHKPIPYLVWNTAPNDAVFCSCTRPGCSSHGEDASRTQTQTQTFTHIGARTCTHRRTRPYTLRITHAHTR